LAYLNCRYTYFQASDESAKDLPPIPIFYQSNKAIFLVDWIKKGLNTLSPDTRNVFTGIRNPIGQRISPKDLEFAHLHHHDLMKLSITIPELGVVIAGSPVGCVAVLALTRSRLLLPTGVEKSIHSFRLEHILPSVSQETDGKRPNAILSGIAASPVQGYGLMSDPVVPKRWRLVLYYWDHSILTYMLKRDTASGHVDAEALLV
jgi:hypothetical protein